MPAAQDAIVHYYLCAGYAYHYLYTTAERNPGLLSAGGQPVLSAPLASEYAFDPRVRLACDLYNRGLAGDASRPRSSCRPARPVRSQLHIPTPDGGDFTLLDCPSRLRLETGRVRLLPLLR